MWWVFGYIFVTNGQRLVRLRTFRSVHGLVRSKHERRSSRARGADVSFRDVTIKITDSGCDQGCEWHHAPEAWAEIWEKSVNWVPGSEEEGWLSVARRGLAARVTRGQVGADGNVIIERLCLSLPYVEKPLNSKVIKSFVPELRSRKCFCVSGFICSMFRDSYVIYVRYGHYERFSYQYVCIYLTHIHILVVSWTWTVMLHT